MSDLIVCWDKPSVHNIGFDNDKVLKLLPGSNVVDKDRWEKAITGNEGEVNPGIKQLMDDGVIKVKVAPVKAEKKDVEVKLDLLDQLKPKDALELIDDCYDLEQLKLWLDGEKRQKVAQALRSRVKLIETPSKEAEAAAKKKGDEE